MQHNARSKHMSLTRVIEQFSLVSSKFNFGEAIRPFHTEMHHSFDRDYTGSAVVWNLSSPIRLCHRRFFIFFFSFFIYFKFGICMKTGITVVRDVLHYHLFLLGIFFSAFPWRSKPWRRRRLAVVESLIQGAMTDRPRVGGPASHHQSSASGWCPRLLCPVLKHAPVDV